MGFFFPESTVKKAKKGEVSIETLHKLECRACPLDKIKCHTPHMAPSGTDSPIIYILGEAPGEQEDVDGEPFVGKAGQVLRRRIPQSWIERIRFNNCVRTRPPKNRNPTPHEIECCRPSIVRDIEETKPKVILALGSISLNWLINESQIAVWRGRLIPVKVGAHECWMYATFHPSLLLRARKEFPRRDGRTKIIKSENEIIFERDIKYVINNCEVWGQPYIENVSAAYDNCRWLYGERGDGDVRKAERYLLEISDFPHVAIDIETSSDEKRGRAVEFRRMRPYGNGAKILSISFSSYETTYAIALDHPRAQWTKEQREKIDNLLEKFFYETPNCIKVAHNLNYELEWLAYFYGYGIIQASQWADTMAQAFVLDERQGALNLGALTRQYYGFDLKEISDIDVGGLAEQPIEEVLRYNCLDSKYGHRLYRDQEIELLNSGLLPVYEQQNRRISSITLTQLEGIGVHQPTIKKLQVKYAALIDEILKDIHSLKDVREFNKTRHEFNPGSPKDVLDIFVDVIGIRGLYSSVDEEALKQIKHPLAELVLIYRSYAKIKSTYIDSLSKNGGKYYWSDGRMHSRLNATKTRTRRTSSDEPNQQNWPKHPDPRLATDIREVRSEIVAGKDHRLVCIDYGQIEFRVFGMATKDETLCEIIKSRYDVHSEWGQRLATEHPSLIGGSKFLTDKDEMKKMRQEAKNKFVFPSLFGAKPKSISENLGAPIKIVESVQNDFWKTFPGVLKWQEGLRDFYKRYGFVELLSGFRRHGPLDDGAVINTPIQGTACDIVMNAFDRLSECARETDDWVYQPRLMIHDDLSFVVPCHKESVYEDYLSVIIDYMLDCEYGFVNVPLAVEVSEGPNWLDQTEVGVFFSDD